MKVAALTKFVGWSSGGRRKFVLDAEKEKSICKES